MNKESSQETDNPFQRPEHQERISLMDSNNVTEDNPPQPLDSWFLELLACPGCEQRFPLHLNSTQDALDCQCGRCAYPLRDGIPILLVDEATILDETIPAGGR